MTTLPMNLHSPERRFDTAFILLLLKMMLYKIRKFRISMMKLMYACNLIQFKESFCQDGLYCSLTTQQLIYETSRH